MTSEDGHVDKRMRVEGSRSAARARINGSGSGLHLEAPAPPPSVFKVTGLVVTDHVYKVPLDHSGQVQGEIEVFVRELVSAVNIGRRNMPYLLFLQGGPGFESPRVTENNGWLKVATNTFKVLLMDQRGTGRSTPITVRNLAKRGSPQQQAQYLSYFRADSIVRDAELIRKAVVAPESNQGKWSILGQSFGGFCVFTYLSLAPEALIEAMATGGIPPDIAQPCSAEDVYRALYRRVANANQRYYRRFPGDVAQVQRIVSFLSAQPGGGFTLPDGTLLTPRALQTLGLSGLGSGGGFERLHYLLEAFFDHGEDDINPSFIKAFGSWSSFDTNPLYALLHESIYCQGAASNWAAHRVRQEPEFRELFDAEGAANAGRPVHFTGEMVFPWMFEDYAALRPYRAAADLLAAKSDWGPLYNTRALRESRVPVAAATYLEDMYVDYNLAQATAAHVPELRQWVTNEYKHSGIRDDGYRIIERLLGMTRDTVLLE